MYELLLNGEPVDRAPLANLEQAKVFFIKRKQMTEKQLKEYLEKIKDEELYAYNVYQIEGEGRSLFSKIKGDENTIMGLPIKQIKQYLKAL